MGDRSQVCIKDGKQKVYLYGHWIGSGIYGAIGRALRKAPDRHRDSEYLARVVFQEMLGGDDGTTGFGIGVTKHSDIEHAIPVLDCDTQTVTFEDADQPHEPVKFSVFQKDSLSGAYDQL